MKKIILAYIPVLHQGYRQFFEKYVSEVQTLYILGNELIKYSGIGGYISRQGSIR